MPTGISDETVSNRGAINCVGCVGKNSFKYFEICPRGLRWTTVFNTTLPAESVRIRLTEPEPNDGLESARAVVFSPTGPMGTSSDAVVSNGDGEMTDWLES